MFTRYSNEQMGRETKARKMRLQTVNCYKRIITVSKVPENDLSSFISDKSDKKRALPNGGAERAKLSGFTANKLAINSVPLLLYDLGNPERILLLAPVRE